jgi:uncharacterized protein (DUF4415 family)
MPKSEDLVRVTLEEAKAMIARGEDGTDWARVKAMTEEDIERAIAEDPESDPPVDWSTLYVGPLGPKRMVNLRLDPDVLAFFKGGGRGYQTRINAVLRAYVNHARNRGG